LNKGDIVYPCVGSIGNSCVIEANGKYHIQQNIAKITCNKLTSPYYISHFLMSHLGMKEVLKFNATSSQPNVLVGSLRKFKINLPELLEQQKTASFLTAVDTKINQLTKKKALLEDYKKGVMQQIFSQDIRFKDDSGNDFPEWEEKKLRDAVLINPKSKQLPNSFIYVDLESVNSGVLKKEDRVLLIDAPSRAQRLLKKQDILFQTVRPYQRNNYFFDKEELDYVASTGYAQIRTKNSSKYIYHYLHNDEFVNKVLLRCTGTSYPAINSTDLGKIKIQIPSNKEQSKIADFLSVIDKKIEVVNNQLEKTITFKKGLLQQMFV